MSPLISPGKQLTRCAAVPHCRGEPTQPTKADAMNPTMLLLVQLALILGAARACGALLQRFRAAAGDRRNGRRPAARADRIRRVAAGVAWRVVRLQQLAATVGPGQHRRGAFHVHRRRGVACAGRHHCAGARVSTGGAVRYRAAVAAGAGRRTVVVCALCSARHRLLALRLVHCRSDVGDCVSGAGAHPQGPQHDPYASRPPGPGRGGDRRCHGVDVPGDRAHPDRRQQPWRRCVHCGRCGGADCGGVRRVEADVCACSPRTQAMEAMRRLRWCGC